MTYAISYFRLITNDVSDDDQQSGNQQFQEVQAFRL